MNIRQFLEKTAEKSPHKTYLYFKDQEIIYRQFDRNVNRVSNAVLKLGIRKGDRFCIMMRNCPEFLYTWFGLNKIGAIMVPINAEFREKEAHYIIAHSEARAVLASTETLPVVRNIRKSYNVPEHVISLGRPESEDILSFQDLCHSSSPLLGETDVSEEDVATIIYTSGTTGAPKGVMQAHKTYVLCGEAYVSWLEIESEDRLMTCLPLYHANAQYYSTMGSLAANASLVLIERFSASLFWEEAVRYQATILNHIGAMLMILFKGSPSRLDRAHRIRYTYGTPAFESQVRDAMEERFGFHILAGYALTESPFGTIEPLQTPRKNLSIGKPRTHPQHPNFVKIVDDRGRELPSGQTGEIILKNAVVMKGYFKDPLRTAEALRDGWLYTGDNAWRDEEGFFYFVDRKKDVIRRRGENISSAEIELVVEWHPGVLESAVIGVPSDISDEEVKLFIVPKPGATIKPEEIFRWCGERLARFKVPRYLEIRDSFPKTPTHKVEKYKLRQEVHDPTRCTDRETLQKEQEVKSHWTVLPEEKP